MVVMEHYMHELPQIEVSKSDKLKLQSLLSAKEMTRYRGGLGRIGWLLDLCCPQLSLHSPERHRRQNDATIQDILNIEQHDSNCQID